MAVQSPIKTSPEQLARALVEAASDHKANDIVLLDLRNVSIIADFFVICTGTSERQINALVRALDERGGEMGNPPRKIEGSSEAGWVLMDFDDVIAHVFGPEQRDFYRLDDLWRDAHPLLVIQ